MKKFLKKEHITILLCILIFLLFILAYQYIKSHEDDTWTRTVKTYTIDNNGQIIDEGTAKITYGIGDTDNPDEEFESFE